jgi:hypothetical protein
MYSGVLAGTRTNGAMPAASAAMQIWLVVSSETRMLDVDIERVETRGRRDLGDLDLAHEAHRHRCHHLVPRELLLDAVAQYVADPRPPAAFPCVALFCARRYAAADRDGRKRRPAARRALQ